MLVQSSPGFAALLLLAHNANQSPDDSVLVVHPVLPPTPGGFAPPATPAAKIPDYLLRDLPPAKPSAFHERCTACLTPQNIAMHANVEKRIPREISKYRFARQNPSSAS
jgi:hypothetical protein